MEILEKMYLKFLFFVLAFIFSIGSSYAQVASQVNVQEQSSGIVAPAPTAFAFAKYITSPVSKYTGIPEIGIPIWEIQLKDFALPISLKYHAGGIKVEEIASNVGLGWSLMAGGVITRVVKDKPDDHTAVPCLDSWLTSQGTGYPLIDDFTYCGNGLLWALSAPSNRHFDGLDTYDIDLTSFNGPPGEDSHSMNLVKKFYGVSKFPDKESIYLLSMVDKEPDIFYFNFAGRTGEFVFDVSEGAPKVRMFPYQDLIVEYTTNAAKKLDRFQITDEHGIVYIFDAIETTKLSTRGNSAPLDYGYDETNGLVNQVLYYETSHAVKQFASSWFLSRIETPLGEFLNFSYEDEEYVMVNRGPQQTGLAYTSPSPGSIDYDPNDLENGPGYYNSLVINRTEIQGKRISKIENDDLRIDFNANHKREDLAVKSSIFGFTNPSLAIDEIVIYDKIGQLQRKKKMKLFYDYFLSYTEEPINPTGNLADNLNLGVEIDQNDVYYRRLRLRGIQEFGETDESAIPPYKFEYKYSDFTNVAWHRLPHRLSFQQDLWGYYNAAAGNNTLIPELFVYPDHYPIKDSRQFRIYRKSNYTGREIRLRGALRTPDPNTVDIGVLTKIIYPTKGSTTYEFGYHVFNDEGEDYRGGGLRIMNITKYDGINPASNIRHEYSYFKDDDDYSSSGHVVSKPIFAVRNTDLSFLLGAADGDSELGYAALTTRYSVPQSTVGRTNGSYVGYRRVCEYISGNGKTVYKYSMPGMWRVENDIPNSDIEGVCDPDLEGHCDGIYSLTPVFDIFASKTGSHRDPAEYDFSQNPAAPNTFPFPENPNYDWQRGHLLSEEVYSEDGGLLKEKICSYANYFPSGKTEPTKVFGIKVSHHYPLLTSGIHPNAYVFRTAKYEILTDVAKQLAEVREISYDQNDLSEGKVIITEYRYENPVHTQYTEKTTFDSRNKVLKTINQYPTDFTGSELGSDLLRTKHMNGHLIRQLNYVDDQLVSKTETNFTNVNEIILPESVTNYPNGEGEFTKVKYEYDVNGNISETFRVLEEDEAGIILNVGKATSYFWAYNNTKPIVKAINLDRASLEAAISSTLFSLGYGGGLGHIDDLLNDVSDLSDPNAKSKWIDFNNVLRDQSITSSAFISTYTYDPLIGISSQTDQNGKMMIYEYDEINRLKLVRDDLGNIVSRYTYQYKVE